MSDKAGRRRAAPLERRMALILAVTCIAVVLALGWLEWRARRAVTDAARRANANLASSIADHASQVLRQADGAVTVLAAQAGRPGADISRDGAVRDMLLRQTGTGSVLRDLCVYDEQGRLLLSAYEDRRYERSATGRDYYARHAGSARDDAFIGAPLRNQGDGAWMIPLSHRISDDNGAFRGLVVGFIDARQFDEYLAQFDIGRWGSVALVTGSGMLIARRSSTDPGDSTGRYIGDLPLFRDHITTSARGSVQLRSGIDGVERDISFERSESYPVIATVGAAPQEILAEWSAAAVRTTIACAVLLGFVAVLSRRVLQEQARQGALLHELARSQRHLEDLERAVREHAVVAVTDVKGDIVSVNRKFCELSQYREDELIGRNHRLLKSGLHPPEFYREMWRTVAGGGVWKGRIANRRKDGTIYHLETTIVPIRSEDGRPERYVAIRTDVTELRSMAQDLGAAKQDLERANRELEELAGTDPLTWLANRRRFDAALQGEFERARRSGLPVSLMMVDVDRFKLYNDTYGHPAGDECLRRVAAALKTAEGRPGDLAGRWGGEEFVVLLPATDGPGAMVVAERARQAIAQLQIAHRHNEGGVVTVSIGIAALEWASPLHAAEALVEGADEALYRAKQGGRNRCILGRLGPASRPAGHGAPEQRAGDSAAAATVLESD